MKKLLLLIIVGLLIMSTHSFAQNKVYSVDESMLTEQQKTILDAKGKSAAIDVQIDQVSKFAGMGEEIGEAMEGALGAVKDNSIELADSELGQFVMMLVAWKVLWIHVLRIGVGFMIFIIATMLFAWSYFRTIKIDESNQSYGVTLATAAAMHWVLWILTVAASGIIMFA